MNDTFSIVIPSHRRVDLLKLCLESVIRFAPPGTQVIVVDDGSTNTTVSKTANTFPNVEVIRFRKSQGFCHAANAGIGAARSEIVELLNDDAEVTREWYVRPLHHFQDPVSRDAEALRSGARDAELAPLRKASASRLTGYAESTVAAVTPLILQSGNHRIDSAGDDYDRGGFAVKRLHNQTAENLQATEVKSVSACAAFYRRSALLEVGGFPEEFGAYFDDVDLSLRLRRAGFTLHFEPDSIVWHRVSSTYGKPTRRLIEQQSRNEEWLYWRNSASVKTLPRHAAVLAAKALRRFEEGTLGPWLSGRIRAFRSSPPARSALCGPTPSPVRSS